MKFVSAMGTAVVSVAFTATSFAGQTVSLQQVPAPARETIQKTAAGAKITEVERESEAGKTIYEAEFTVDGQKREIKVTSDGKLLSNERD